MANVRVYETDKGTIIAGPKNNLLYCGFPFGSTGLRHFRLVEVGKEGFKSGFNCREDLVEPGNSVYLHAEGCSFSSKRNPQVQILSSKLIPAERFGAALEAREQYRDRRAKQAKQITDRYQGQLDENSESKEEINAAMRQELDGLQAIPRLEELL